jgi:hypothetical protein
MITLDELKELVEYDSNTGLFTRKKRTSNRIKEGQTIVSKDAKGYICFRLKNKMHKAHRLAWFYVHGKFPNGEIDHINGVVYDNRICNLRDVTKSVNQQNRKSVRGYSKDGNRWKAQIRADGKWRHLGCFETENEAHDAYLKAKSFMHMKAKEA